MSKKSNVHPDYYKTAGSGRPGDGLEQSQQKRRFAEEEAQRAKKRDEFGAGAPDEPDEEDADVREAGAADESDEESEGSERQGGERPGEAVRGKKRRP